MRLENLVGSSVGYFLGAALFVFMGGACGFGGITSRDFGALALLLGGGMVMIAVAFALVALGLRKISQGTGPLYARLASQGIDPQAVNDALAQAEGFKGVWLTDRWLVCKAGGGSVIPYREIAFLHGTGDGLVLHRYGNPALSIGSQGDDFLAALRRRKHDLLFGNNAKKLAKIAMERVGQ